MDDAARRHAEEEAARLAAMATMAERTLELTTRETTSAPPHPLATAVLNVKALMLITLDQDANNYKWHALFVVILGKCSIMHNVLSDEDLTDRLAWVQMDCTVLTLIYGRISHDLQQSVMLQ
jgi:hypothetical protein